MVDYPLGDLNYYLETIKERTRMGSKFFTDLVNELKDEDVNMADSGNNSAEFSKFIDTGSYAFNAAVCGDIFGGMADNKVLAIAGETSTGKTFFALGIVKHFLDTHPDAAVWYADTEAAVTKDMMASRGIDVSRVIIAEPVTVQQFRHKAITFLDAYSAQPEKNRPPLMMVLDSIGMLSTTKELEDSTEGSDTKDMTRAQIIRSAFRVLRLKLSKAKVPMVVTSHTYACVTAGTEVRMADGSIRKIEEVSIGDDVATLIGTHDVTDIVSYDEVEVADLELSDGTTLTAALDHRFLTSTGWKTVEELNEGDVLVDERTRSDSFEATLRHS